MRNLFAMSVVACALTSAANAGIIHFTNPAQGEPGHYDWRFSYYPNVTHWLNITKSPDEQSDTANGNSIGQAKGTVLDVTWTFNPSEGAFLLSKAGLASAVTLEDGAPVQVSDGLEWASDVTYFYFIDVAKELEPLFFTLGERCYLGVLTMSGNYGWVEVELVTDPDSFWTLIAHAWAYETEVGVPIYAGQIPTPGGATMFALGAVCCSARRRRCA